MSLELIINEDKDWFARQSYEKVGIEVQEDEGLL